MSRRGLAKKNIKKTVRTWVKAYVGKDIVNAYRKHYSTTRSCTIVELSSMGIPFPPEVVEEAKRLQVSAVKHKQAKKAKKLAEKNLRELTELYSHYRQPDLDDYGFCFLIDECDAPKSIGLTYEEVIDELVELDFDRDFDEDPTFVPDPPWADDDYDPFAD